MDKYTGKKVEGTLIVGQVWRDDSNGEPDVTIIEIGEKLSTKGRSQMGASHDYLHSKVKAITQTEGNEDQEHWDAENLLDYLECNCYAPDEMPVVKDIPEDIEASIPASLQKDLEDGANGWPLSNTPGNCWCGHVKEAHMIKVEDNSQICNLCQCVGYVEDKWVGGK